MLAPWKESYDKSRWCFNKQRHHFANKGPYSHSYGSSNSHLQMGELVHKEGWVPKNWCIQIMVLEKTLENPLDARRSYQSVLKEISLQYFLEKLFLNLKLWYSGHQVRRANSLEKTLMLERLKAKEGVDRGQYGSIASPAQGTWIWHSGGQRSLASHSTWGHRELDMT